MNDLRHDRNLRLQIGIRLKEFRGIIMAQNRISNAEFSEESDIPLNKLKSYESGDLPPDANDLLKLHIKFGLNINWLYSGKGKML